MSHPTRNCLAVGLTCLVLAAGGVMASAKSPSTPAPGQTQPASSVSIEFEKRRLEAALAEIEKKSGIRFKVADHLRDTPIFPALLLLLISLSTAKYI